MTPQQEQDFEAFWRLYPRKIGKGYAKECFARALSRAPAKAILWAIGYQVRTNALGNEEAFQPHASTWLNQDRWLDGFNSLEELGKPKRARDTFRRLPE